MQVEHRRLAGAPRAAPGPSGRRPAAGSAGRRRRRAAGQRAERRASSAGTRGSRRRRRAARRTGRAREVRDAVAVVADREDRGVEAEALLGEDLERPERALGDREARRAVAVARAPRWRPRSPRGRAAGPRGSAAGRSRRRARARSRGRRSRGPRAAISRTQRRDGARPPSRARRRSRGCRCRRRASSRRRVESADARGLGVPAAPLDQARRSSRPGSTPRGRRSARCSDTSRRPCSRTTVFTVFKRITRSIKRERCFR